MIHADEDNGVWVTWTGYDGNSYETQPISWDEFKENNYRFDMADYFGEKTSDNKLYDANGEPVFRHEIALSVHEKATIDDIIKCINEVPIYSGQSFPKGVQFEDWSEGSKTYDGIEFSYDSWRYYFYYYAAYASNHRTGTGDNLESDKGLNFDGADDDFLEPRDADGNKVQNQTPQASQGNLTSMPSASTVEEARESTEGWEFSFYMDGIGTVTAKSGKVSYHANSDFAPDDEHEYWDWQGGWELENGEYVWNPEHEKASIERTVSSHGSGTLGDVMDALTGSKGSGTPGLLSEKNGGNADTGGFIYIEFDLRSNSSFKYGPDIEENIIGKFTIKITVTNEDTEETVLNRIQTALNDKTILDFYSSGTSTASFSNRPTANSHKIKIPVYADKDPGDDPPAPPAEPDEEISVHGFFVQAGPEAGMHIDIEYESLSLKSLGMESTNVLTAEDADNAINSVKKGLEIVSSQRSTFGAYQNRLEHAYNINQNSEENTQYAESQIRDTDIARLMVDYANQNILSQAGTSMLAQANQQPGMVMQLLQ